MEQAAVDNAFQNIPVNELLAIASDVQAALRKDPALAQTKESNQVVTQADLRIQRKVLQYFAGTDLAGQYIVKAEEQLGSDCTPQAAPDADWQLIVDPLDGTDSFCRGESDWGTMVGLADRSGRLIVSWNMTADGVVYSSEEPQTEPPLPWSARLNSSRTLRFDVFDYGAGAANRFTSRLAELSGGMVRESDIRVRSIPSAVSAGWRLCSGELDGLLWLPSIKGKKSYPDYDLVFLGALAERGWKTLLGKDRDSVLMLVVAPSEPDLELLTRTGLVLLERPIDLKFERQLTITSAVEAAR